MRQQSNETWGVCILVPRCFAFFLIRQRIEWDSTGNIAETAFARQGGAIVPGEFLFAAIIARLTELTHCVGWNGGVCPAIACLALHATELEHRAIEMVLALWILSWNLGAWFFI